MASIADFLSGIGVNTHLDATTTPYGDVPLVQGALAYLGVSLIRDHAYDIDLPAYRVLTAAGVGLDLIVDDDAQAEIDSLLPVAGSIRFFEGPNEVDIQPITTNGIADPVAAALAEQHSVYLAAKSTAAVSAVPVIVASVGDPNNLPIFAGALADADIVNLHAYAAEGNGPYQVLSDDLLAAAVPPGMPVVVTETGYYTLPNNGIDPSGVDLSVQARLTLDTLFDSASLGMSATFLYELFDESADPQGIDPEQHYGLFTADGAPKPAATALHSLTAILAGAGAIVSAAFATAPAITGLPDTGRSLVLTGAAGASVIAVWAEPPIWDAQTQTEIAPPATTVTVAFGTIAGLVTVYDPLAGTVPIATGAGLAQVTFTLTDHPILIAIARAAVAVPVPDPIAPIVVTPLPAAPAAPIVPAVIETVSVYRFFDTVLGTHFYTTDPAEARAILASRPDLVPEGADGIGLQAIDPASHDPAAVPVYRFFETGSGTHFFTASAAERDGLIATRPDLGYEPASVFYEHTVAQPGDTPVYRFFDTTNGTHFYSDSPSERAAILTSRPDLVAEGIGFYEPAAHPAA